MAAARTDMAREIYRDVSACLSVPQIDGDVKRETNLTITLAMHCEQS